MGPSVGGGDRLFTPVHFPNFAFQGPLNKVDMLPCMDAGCDVNIPFVPLLRPEPEVNLAILALDQSGGRDQYISTNLQLAAQYARRFNWPFPDVSQALKVEPRQKSKSGKSMTAASCQPLTVCEGDVEKAVPTVLYMSLLRDERFHPTFCPRQAPFCSTSNWTYTSDEIDLLTGLTAHNTRNSIELIRKVLRKLVGSRSWLLGRIARARSPPTPTSPRTRSSSPWTSPTVPGAPATRMLTPAARPPVLVLSQRTSRTTSTRT